MIGDMAGKVVLLTGGSGGLGQSVTRAFLAAGAKIVLSLSKRSGGDALNDYTEDERSRLFPIETDVTDADSVEQLFSIAKEKVGRPAVLLNLVGGYSGGHSLLEVSPEVWETQLRLNLTSAFLLTRAFLRSLSEGETDPWGRIVLVSSRAGQRPTANQAAYNVAKAGIVTLTESVAEDIKHSLPHVTINAVLPSVIDTPANRRALPKSDPSRWVTPQQLADILLFLASDESAALHGTAIPVLGRV